MKFKVTYPSGVVEECEHSDDNQTIAGFINAKFGSVDPAEHGVTVEEISESPTVTEATPEVVPTIVNMTATVTAVSQASGG
jgi:hypothetical protein